MAVVTTLSKGYYLDYIWCRVGSSAMKDGASYYLQAAELGGEPTARR